MGEAKTSHWTDSFFEQYNHKKVESLRGEIVRFEIASHNIITDLKNNVLQMPNYSRNKVQVHSGFFTATPLDLSLEPSVVFNAWDFSKDLIVIAKVTFSGNISIALHKVEEWNQLGYVVANLLHADRTDKDEISRSMENSPHFTSLGNDSAGKLIAIFDFFPIDSAEKNAKTQNEIKAALS